MVKAPGPEEVEEAVSLGAALPCVAAPKLPERAHDELHLCQVRATPRAGPPVRFAALTIGRGQRTVQVGGDELYELLARHAGRWRHQRLTPLPDMARAPPAPSPGPGGGAPVH